VRILVTSTPGILAALDSLDVDAIATTGTQVDPSEIGPAPANVRVERYVPQSFILDRVSALVSHARAGSMLAGASRGLPQLCLPMGADMWENADALAGSGACPARAPASACLRTLRCARSSGPRGAGSHRARRSPSARVSYSARISALYSALNVRRVGLAAGSVSSSVTLPVWARPFNDAVMVMVLGFLSCPVVSDDRAPQVSHLTLTVRGSADMAAPVPTSSTTQPRAIRQHGRE
jgi:hypothetical protein